MAGISTTRLQGILAIIRGEGDFHVALTNGGSAVVDASDRELVEQYSWFNCNGYARTRTKSGKVILLHRLIMGDGKPGLVIDHEDGDGLNNRRYNLRWASHRENMRNRTTTVGKSRFKGVWLDRSAWRAEIQLNGKKIRLGSFTKEADAARAYDRAAKEYHGDFAKTNADLGLYKLR